MTELQKEYCEEKGLICIKPENTEIADYVNWLETQTLEIMEDFKLKKLPPFSHNEDLVRSIKKSKDELNSLLIEAKRSGYNVSVFRDTHVENELQTDEFCCDNVRVTLSVPCELLS